MTEPKKMGRRDFIKKACELTGATLFVGLLPFRSPPAQASDHAAAAGEGVVGSVDGKDHLFAYLIDTRKCIGCGMCVKACSQENKVPDGFFRTWVERYEMSELGDLHIDSPKGAKDGFPPVESGFTTTKGFFVPKMCNHCSNTPCTQVCPVGASFSTKEGVVLIDKQRCIGCGYCVQACPYASRFINPETKTADKCTWCYHRLAKGLPPACVQACPTEARMFGDLKDKDDPVRKILGKERVGVLQQEKLTKPSCFYLGLDKEVR